MKGMSMSIKKLVLCGVCLLAVAMTGLFIASCSDKSVTPPTDDGDYDYSAISEFDSLAFFRYADSVKTADSLRNVRVQDSIRVADSLANAALLDSLIKADEAAYYRYMDSLAYVGRLKADSLKADSIFRADSMARVIDSLAKISEEEAAAAIARAASLAAVKVVLDSLARVQDSIDRVERIPAAVRTVLGRGYDAAGYYASMQSLKPEYYTILDIYKLARDNRVQNNGVSGFNGYTIQGSTVQKYQEDFSKSKSISVSGSYSALAWGASFSAQTKQTFSSTATSSSEYSFATYSALAIECSYSIVAHASEYRAYLTDGFKNDLDNMNPDALVAKYGTHVLVGGVFGGRLDYNMSMAKTSTSSQTNFGSYVTATAKVSGFGAEAGIQISNEEQRKIEQSFNTATSEVSVYAYGGDNQHAAQVQVEGALGDAWSKWVQSVQGKYTLCDFPQESLMSLSELASTSERARAIRDAINKYLGNGMINFEYELAVRNVEGSKTGVETTKRYFHTFRGDNTVPHLYNADYEWQIDVTSVELSQKQSNGMYNKLIITYDVKFYEIGGDNSIIGVKDYSVEVGLDGKNVVGIEAGYESGSAKGNYRCGSYNSAERVARIDKRTSELRERSNLILNASCMSSTPLSSSIDGLTHSVTFNVQVATKQPVSGALSKKTLRFSAK
jgi:hypothetical protein